MSRRGVYALVNFLLLGAALAVMFLLPQYAAYALYATVGWVAAGLALSWTGRIGVRGAPGSALPTATTLGGRRLADAGAPAAPIDFCIYCGRRFGAGETVCPECRHALPISVA